MQLFSKIQEFFPRQEERFPTFAAVEIMTASGALITKATLRDISKTGGFIHLNQEQVLPEEFEMWIPKLGRTVKSSTKWRSMDEAGVRFEEEVDLEVFLVHRRNRAEKVAKYFVPLAAAA